MHMSLGRPPRRQALTCWHQPSGESHQILCCCSLAGLAPWVHAHATPHYTTLHTNHTDTHDAWTICHCRPVEQNTDIVPWPGQRLHALLRRCLRSTKLRLHVPQPLQCRRQEYKDSSVPHKLCCVLPHSPTFVLVASQCRHLPGVRAAALSLRSPVQTPCSTTSCPTT